MKSVWTEFGLDLIDLETVRQTFREIAWSTVTETAKDNHATSGIVTIGAISSKDNRVFSFVHNLQPMKL